MNSSTTGLSNLMATIYSKDFLERAEAETVFDFIATKKSIARNSGKTVIFNRFSALPVRTTPLTECTNPAGSDITATQVSATLAEYGDYVKVCSLFELTSIDEDLREHIATLASQGARTVDALIAAEVSANATVIYANSKTAVSAVGTSDVVDGSDIRRAVRTLKRNYAHPFRDGYFHGIIPVSNEYDLRADTEWLDAYKYTDAENLRNGEIGRLHGVKFVSANYEISEAGTGGAVVYSTIIAGRDAVGMVSLQGQESTPRIIVKNGDNNSDTSNPLNMFSTVGWKITMAVKVLNANWIVAIKSSTLG